MKELLKNKWFLIISIILIVGIIALIFFGVKKYLDSQDAYSRESRQNFSNSNLTYENLEYQNMALGLLDAMSGPGYDMDKIREILLRLKNKDDWYKLVNVFGKRETTAWYSTWSGNLVEWFIDEMYSSDESEVRSILARIGVTM
ncbi:MAG: hypothetical protein PHE56_13065 [Bacteroidales bacterium]|nr:hypothetical protein [Bacteroidales bacterium]